MSAIKTRTRHAVAKIGEIAAGERKMVNVPAFGKEIEIGVFNVGGKYFAYRNVCPHAGAPVCQGKICGTTLPSSVGEYILARQGEILRCPWHGWEFDLTSGEHLVDEKMKLRAYAVEAEVETSTGTSTGTSTATACDENLEAFAVETQGETIWVLI